MPQPLLLIEDTPSLQTIYRATLERAGYTVVAASTVEEGLAQLRAARPEVVLLDLLLPDGDGLELMQTARQEGHKPNFIVVTAHGSINRAVDAMRTGAFDFMVKPFDETVFLTTVRNALAAMTAKADAPQAPVAPALVGSSQAIAVIHSKIRSVSRSLAPIFITGESGTGKESCARAVHGQSLRARGPFVPVQCAGLSGQSGLAALTGQTKGAFEGATADLPGAILSADRGTLYLSDICELEPELQSRLLRFLQTMSVTPLGGVSAAKVNTRIIAATRYDPLERIRAGRLREDLYYRLHVVPIKLPPLRQRGSDVIEIAERSLQCYAKTEGRELSRLSEEIRRLFLHLSWPGNVRQLLNTLRGMLAISDSSVLTRDMLPPEFHSQAGEAEAAPADGLNGLSLDGLIGKPLWEIERIVIEETIAAHGGSIPRAAKVLDVSPSTIYRKREAWAKGVTG